MDRYKYTHRDTADGFVRSLNVELKSPDVKIGPGPWRSREADDGSVGTRRHGRM